MELFEELLRGLLRVADSQGVTNSEIEDAREYLASCDAKRSILASQLELERKRDEVADEAFMNSDIPPLSDSGRWTRDGNIWVCKVYLDSGEPGSFGVEFAEGTTEIVDTWSQ
jgi:hypothetical protein